MTCGWMNHHPSVGKLSSGAVQNQDKSSKTTKKNVRRILIFQGNVQHVNVHIIVCKCVYIYTYVCVCG